MQVPQQSSRSTCRSVRDRTKYKASRQRLRIFRHGRDDRYCIVFGPNSRKVRKRLINEGATLKLSKAVETSKATLESMRRHTNEVHSVRKNPRDGKHQADRKSPKPNQAGDTRKCSGFGGKLHGKSTSFPAYGQKCQKASNFTKVCRSRSCKRIDPRLSTDPSDFFIETVTSTGDNTPDKAFVLIEIGT